MGYGWPRKVSFYIDIRFKIDMKLHINLFSFVFPILRYHSLAPMYYRGAQAAIVVYDIQNQDSFQRAKTWVKELQRQVNSRA